MKRAALSSVVMLGLVVMIARERDEKEGARSVAAQAESVSTQVNEGVKKTPRSASLSAALPAEPFAYQREIEEYARLSAKVFMTDEERVQRVRLVHDEKLMAAAGRLVLRPTADDPRLARERDLTLSLLLEARRAGEPSALSALRAVIGDPQVEDESLARPTREELAGVKAEVLYEWAAESPADAEQLAGLLPGPVSRRLWQNVRAKQATNLAESAAENEDGAH